MSNWKERDMCEPYLNENEDENPFISGGPFWEVTFRTSWTDLKGETEQDSFEERRMLAGENAVGFLLDYFFKESGPFALEYGSGETPFEGPTYQTINCREYHEVFNPPPTIDEQASGKLINLPVGSSGNYYIPGQGENDSAVGHFLESGPQGKLLFHVKINKTWIDRWSQVPEQLQDMQGEAPFAIVIKLENFQDDINELADTIFGYYKGRMEEATQEGYEFNLDLEALGKEMKKFPKTIGDYLRKVSPYVCDWGTPFEMGVDTNYDDRIEFGFNGDLTLSYVALAADPKRQNSTGQTDGEDPPQPDAWIAVPSRVGIECLNMTVPFDNARLVNILMRMYSMTDEQPGT
jgi:hypothetical protein